MALKQVILLCNYTNSSTRSHLQLSNLKVANVIRHILGLPKLKYVEAAPWIEAFIKFFREEKSFQLHIVALQVGMKREYESFDADGVAYHYIKSGLSLWSKVSDKLFDIQTRKGFPIYRRRFAMALKGIKPDVVLMSGAENPDYAAAFLNIDCSHKLVIMQTLMNDPKRISMGVSTDYRRALENRVLSNCRHFAVPDVNWIQYVKQVNPAAECYPFTFPTIKPIVNVGVEKKYDFIFFAGMLGRNKGVNDLVSAFRIVAKNHPSATLNIIGGAHKDYMNNLHEQVREGCLENNITFTPSFKKREDVFKEVVKAKYAVLPGITASLNSTVRETMFMGMPTIVYETSDTLVINKDDHCILTAKMEDVDDLASKLVFALTHNDEMKVIGDNGKMYANSHFSQEAFNNCFSRIINKVLE